MRMLKSFVAIAVLFVGVGALMVSALPKETPIQKADRAFCNQLVKSHDTRQACYKVAGISNNAAFIDGHIVQISFADRWAVPTKTAKLSLSDPEEAGDLADADEAASKRVLAQGK